MTLSNMAVLTGSSDVTFVTLSSKIFPNNVENPAVNILLYFLKIGYNRGKLPYKV